ncbi:MFS transporter [Ammoniphilus resinae]|uniref:MFS transporter n=1 Tax=Ammoniphilus resinae TaxID=861532 RepID=A0ABS4GM69_9BACL|nr:MFS transporter [Ammoniphilus resinae]MBP1931361.1 hypothetical protein [Ammoniphilus resinae]
MGLGKELRFLLLTTVIFSIINSYVTIFINLYIWEKYHQISQVAWFNITMLIFWGVAFTIAGKIFTVYSLQVTMRIASLMALTAFYFLLAFPNASPFLWNLSIGASVGFMCGTYFMSQNIFISFYGKGEELNTYFYLYTIAQQFLSILNPIVFAIIIKLFGYATSFIIVFSVVCILFILTFYIPNVTLSKEDKEKPFFRVQNPWMQMQKLRSFLSSCFFMGFLLQFQLLFTQLYTFHISENKIIIAGLNVLYTILTIGAYFFARKAHIPHTRQLQWGVVLMGMAYLLAIYPEPLNLVLLNVFSAIGYFFLITNWNSNQFNYMRQFKSTTLTKVIIGREVILNIGRIIMLLLIAQVKEFSGLTYQGMIIFILACIVVLFFIEQKRSKVEKKQTSSGVSL